MRDFTKIEQNFEMTKKSGLRIMVTVGNACGCGSLQRLAVTIYFLAEENGRTNQNEMSR